MAILEAGATGLPVVSTRHAGIPDVIVEGETGFLVDERDVGGMAQHMVTLAADPQLAASMGHAAQRRIRTHFSMERRLDHLWQIIESCMSAPGRPNGSASHLDSHCRVDPEGRSVAIVLLTSTHSSGDILLCMGEQ